MNRQPRAVAVLVAAALTSVLVGAATTSKAVATEARTIVGTSTQSASPLGPLPAEAAFLDSFAFDPRSPQIVYVIAGGSEGPSRHVFKTTDGGAHWHATPTSGSGWVGVNEALASDPRHPGTLYAGTQFAVYKTVDGGRSWQPSKRGLPAPPHGDRVKGWVIALAVDPADTSIVYAGSDRVSKSSDGGRSWRTVFPSHPTPYRDSISALAIAGTSPETIYATTADSTTGFTSIYQSTDAGTSWHATKVVRGIQGGGYGLVTALAVEPRHPTTVYAALGANVLKTTNAGKTWQSIAHGLPIAANLSRGGCHCQGSVTALAVDPRRAATVYTALSQGGIYKTTNGGRTWTRVTSIRLGLDYTVAVDPARPSTVYAAVQSQSDTGSGRGLILRSTNSGSAWAVAG